MGIYKAYITPPLGVKDRDGDSYNSKSFDGAVFDGTDEKKYPLLLDHGKSSRGKMPIGVAKVMKEDTGRYFCELEFNEKSDSSGEFKSLAEQGAYGISAGFVGFKASDKTLQMHDFLEVSLVSMPAVKESKVITTKSVADADEILLSGVDNLEDGKAVFFKSLEVFKDAEIVNTQEDVKIEKTKSLDVNKETNLDVNKEQGLDVNKEPNLDVNKEFDNLTKKIEDVNNKVEGIGNKIEKFTNNYKTKSMQDLTDVKKDGNVEYGRGSSAIQENDMIEKSTDGKKIAKSMNFAQSNVNGLQNILDNGFSKIQKAVAYAENLKKEPTAFTMPLADFNDLKPFFYKGFERSSGHGLYEKAGTHTDGATAYAGVKSDGTAPFFALNYIQEPWAIMPRAVNLMSYLPFREMQVDQIHIRSNGVKVWSTLKGAQAETPSAEFTTNAISNPISMGRVAAYAKFYEGLKYGQDEFLQSLMEVVYVNWLDDINTIIVNGCTASTGGIAIKGLKDLASSLVTTTGTRYYQKVTTPNILDITTIAIGECAESRNNPNLVLLNPAQRTNAGLLKSTTGEPLQGTNKYVNFDYTNGMPQGMAFSQFNYNSGGIVLYTPAVPLDEMYVVDTTKLTCGVCAPATRVIVGSVGNDPINGTFTISANTAIQQGLADSFSKAVVRVPSISTAITNITKP